MPEELFCYDCKRPANTECVEQKHRMNTEEVECMGERHTPTPWRWQDFGRGLILVSEASGKPIVMDFIRQGMNGAEPRFGKRTDSMGGVMVPLSKWESEPPDMAFIRRAVNNHQALVEKLTRARWFILHTAHKLPDDKQTEAGSLIGEIAAALVLAEKEI